jgi:hypothetical protein
VTCERPGVVGVEAAERLQRHAIAEAQELHPMILAESRLLGIADYRGSCKGLGVRITMQPSEVGMGSTGKRTAGS